MVVLARRAPRPKRWRSRPTIHQHAAPAIETGRLLPPGSACGQVRAILLGGTDRLPLRVSPSRASARQAVRGETATPRSARGRPCTSPSVASGCAATRWRSGSRCRAILEASRPLPRRRRAGLVPAPARLHGAGRAAHPPLRHLAHARPRAAGRPPPLTQIPRMGLPASPPHRRQLVAGDCESQIRAPQIRAAPDRGRERARRRERLPLEDLHRATGAVACALHELLQG